MPMEMERNKVTFELLAGTDTDWLLLSFSSFPVGHSVAKLGTKMIHLEVPGTVEVGFLNL